MAGRRHAPQRLVAALSALIAATPFAIPAQVLATPDTLQAASGLDAAKARVDAAQALVDGASAALAEVRAQLDRADDPAALADLRTREAEAQARKDLLLERLTAAEADLTRVAARLGAAATSPADGADPATPDAAGDRPVIVLPGLSGADPATAATTSAPTTLAPAGITPTPLGTDAAARIDAYLASKGSPLAGLGATFVAEAGRVGLDPRMLVAITGAETSFGTYGPSQLIFNPFGLGPGMRFARWEDAIQRAAQNLGGHLYLADGRVTIPAIQQRWAPEGASNDPTGLNSNWTRNVSHNYAEQGGNPTGSVFTGVTATALLSTPVIPTVGAYGAQAAQDALLLLGTPNSADQPGGLDDAALVQVVYAKAGVALAPTVPGQFAQGTPVEPTALQAGDAVFFSTPDGEVVHVGLYLGAGQFIHAPGPGDTVGLGSLYEPQWGAAYVGARRY